MKSRTWTLTACSLVGMAVMFSATLAAANDAGDGECSDGLCGTPENAGGGSDAAAVKVAGSDLGDTYQDSDDFDTDGLEDDFDNCPFMYNPNQFDLDSDKVGDACDSCVHTYNPDQSNIDGDWFGDVCDDDMDNDGFKNSVDNCPKVANPSQVNSDNDAEGNACDKDDDNDGVEDLLDECPTIHNDQREGSTVGCDLDEDHDGVVDRFDNCPGIANPDQSNLDEDFMGDACDNDMDGDGVQNVLDNCQFSSNTDQADFDRDTIGDVCDPKECFVVDSLYPDACLDTAAPFQVLGGSTVHMNVGETTRLRIFANRQDADIKYTWSVHAAPERSRAVPVNARGFVGVSTPFEYHYHTGKVALFTPDEPGVYEIVLVAELANRDSLHNKQRATAVTILEVSGKSGMTSGCSTSCSAGRFFNTSFLPFFVAFRR